MRWRRRGRLSSQDTPKGYQRVFFLYEKKPGSIVKRVRPGMDPFSFSLVTRNLPSPNSQYIPLLCCMLCKVIPLLCYNSLNPSRGFYRSLALATVGIHHRLRFYISGTSTYGVGNSPIPIYTYSILLWVLSVVYMCVSYSFYISIVYTLFFYTTILYSLSYICFSSSFTLPFYKA